MSELDQTIEELEAEVMAELEEKASLPGGAGLKAEPMKQDMILMILLTMLMILARLMSKQLMHCLMKAIVKKQHLCLVERDSAQKK